MINSRKKNIVTKISMTIGVFFLATLVIRVMPWSNMMTYGGNFYDSLFEYTVNTDNDEITDLDTEKRPKDDNTSSYIYNKYSDTAVNYIRVDGSHYGDGGSYVDCTYGIPKSCPIGAQRYLENLVNERGYELDNLTIEPGDGYHSYISFLWSPDSI